VSGDKTHEQQLRMFERKPDVPDPRRTAEALQEEHSGPAEATADEPRDEKYPVSPQGLHQENRDHNKHNHQGQSGHRPQSHTPDQEKR